MANPPAGWHPDPLNRHAQRYWDGNQWTEHVADQAGNMSTDPLDVAQGSQQQDQYGQQQGQYGQPAAGQAQDAGAWGQPAESTPSWGGGDAAAPGGDQAPTWGDGGANAWGSDTTTTDESSWSPSATEQATPEATTPGSAWDSAGTSTGTGTDDTASAAVVGDTGVPAVGEATGAATSDHPGFASVEVASGIVVRHGGVVARSTGVTSADSVHPGASDLSGAGTVHLAANGRAVRVVEVPTGGLTVRNDALLAHSANLERTGAADGIVGYDATEVSGAGWVAVAGAGGVLEVTAVSGVEVPTSALLAWSSDLSVSHADRVTLTGDGPVLVSTEVA